MHGVVLHVCTKLTLVSDTDLNNQRSEHAISHSLNAILDWHSFWGPRILLNPLRPIVQWYHGRILKNFIGEELRKRFIEMKSERKAYNDSPPKRAKSVIALALEQ